MPLSGPVGVVAESSGLYLPGSMPECPVAGIRYRLVTVAVFRSPGAAESPGIRGESSVEINMFWPTLYNYRTNRPGRKDNPFRAGEPGFATSIRVIVSLGIE